MSFEDDARAIVAEVAPGEDITNVRVGSQAVTVDTSARRWIVRHARDASAETGRFRLYTVGEAELLDTPEAPDGYALGNNGEVFHLNDAADFRRFWHAARSEVTGIEIAGLLSTYQSEAPAHETVVMEPGDDPAGSASASIPPDVTSQGPLMMRFVTQYFLEEPPDYVARRHLVEWSVREDDTGELDWFWTPLSDTNA